MKAPEDQADALFELARELDENQIPYMITGSIALSFYAEPRSTNDIDVVVELQPSDLDTLLSFFPEEEDWYVNRSVAEKAVAQRRMFNVIHPATGLKIDLICLKQSDLERQKFARRKQVSKGKKSLWLISPEDLLLSKLEWGLRSQSAMQSEDVRKLIRDADDLEWDYINEWLDRAGLRTAFENANDA